MKLSKYFATALMALSFACNSGENKANVPSVTKENLNNTKVDNKPYTIIKTIDIDPAAFVQGLIYKDGQLFISTGLEEHSSLRLFDLASATELKNIKIEDVFCEGIAIANNKIFQLTWQDGECFVYDSKTFEKIKTLRYKGEGWGLAYNGTNLIMSDGSNKLKFINPENFSIEKTIYVTDDKNYPLYNLNELEYINGLVWANVWTTDFVVSINPETGKVEKKIDLSELRTLLAPDNKYAEVLNGIAYNSDSKTYYFSGKFWGKVFEVKIK